MSWIDTPMVSDTKADLPTFGEMISKLPFPLNRTTSVDACGDAFVAGIEHRRRRVNCPGWVGAARWIKPVLSTAIVERLVFTFVADLLPRMDAEVIALGRSMGIRTKELEKR
jgi:hypothetical protein